MKQFVLLFGIIKAPLVICFTISPQDTIQAVDTPATFQCQYSDATTVGWIFNGTSIHSYDPPANVSTDILPGSINILTVLALATYNETEVWCIATVFQNGDGRVENSSKAKLIIQGTPSIVNNLMSSSNLDEIVLSWEAPFSLNLTSEPDVAYCVDVYNITANNRASCLILSDCNVLTTHFVYNSSHPNPRDRFQFIVIPRSNMAGARNGTPSQPIVASFLVHPNICVESITFNTSTVFNRGKLHLAFGFPNWKETIIVAYIHEVNSDYPFYSSSYCVCTFSNSTAAAINCANCSTLYPFRKYSITVQCENSAGISNSTNILSTHKIQNKNIIQVSSALSRTVNASCHITANHENMITGCLAIITSDNRSVLPVYKIIPLPSDHNQTVTHSLNFIIGGLSSYSNYRIFLFETLGNLLLPVKFPAETEGFHLSNNQHSIKQGPESGFKSSIVRSVTVSTLENKLVILLKRVDENTQGIIVIYHECSENSKNLILSTAYFNCYENHTMVTVNIKPGCYHVAIFGVTEGYTVEESSAKVVCIDVRDSYNDVSTNDFPLIVPIIGSLFAISIMVIILLSSGIVCKHFTEAHKKSRSISTTNIELKRCEAYEAVSVHTQR